CNKVNSQSDVVVEAEITLTFQTPKLALFIKENRKYVKEVEFLDISQDLESISKQPSNYNYVSQDYLPYFAFERNKFSHKYEFGHTLLVGGSYGKIGAAVLAAKSVLKSGGGLVTVYLPQCGYEIMQTSFPEAMVLTDFSEDKITAFPDIEKFDTIAIGPGLGTDEKTMNAFEQFLNEKDLENKKLVIDADGINLLSQKPELLNKMPENSILTPHDGE